MFVCWLFRQFSCTEQSFLLTDHTCTVWWALSFWSLFLQARNSHAVHLSVITSGDPDAGRTPMCTPFTRRICPEKILNFSRGTWCANKRGCRQSGSTGRQKSAGLQRYWCTSETPESECSLFPGSSPKKCSSFSWSQCCSRPWALPHPNEDTLQAMPCMKTGMFLRTGT